VEEYRTEEEQVEALKRWWDENGKSTIAAIVIAVSASFGWQTWQGQQANTQAAASDSYQVLLNALSKGQDSANPEPAKVAARQLREDYAGSSYAQFAAMHLARLAVGEGDLATAESELRWVLSKADKGGEVAQISQLRLARVLAASGDGDQALSVLAAGEQGDYQASYAIARGDVLLGLGRTDEARAAYTLARMLVSQGGTQVTLASLDQKLSSLSPVPARELAAEVVPALAAEAAIEQAVDTAGEG
jgi:predicted negative regulator of RcsB-dependent stress response